MKEEKEELKDQEVLETTLKDDPALVSECPAEELPDGCDDFECDEEPTDDLCGYDPVSDETDGCEAITESAKDADADNGFLNESEEEAAAYKTEFTEEERLNLVKEFNEHNKGVAYLDDDVPTQEEKDAAVAEFVKVNEEYANMTFLIADAPNSLRVAKFLKNWNEKEVHWDKDLWKGVIMFDAIIKDFIERREKDETLDFVINYGALSYLYIALGNVRGTGLAEAVKQQSINEEYDKIFGVVEDCVNDFKKKGDEVEKAKKTAQFYTAGFKVHFIETPEENRMTKEEFVQNIKDHWEETADLRQKVYENPYQFGLTAKEVEDLKSFRPELSVEDAVGGLAVNKDANKGGEE